MQAASRDFSLRGVTRNPNAPTLVQIADVDTGTIGWINADLVTQIAPSI